jgi:hypothetical protein
MKISRATYFVFVVVVTVMTLSVTVFKGGKGLATGQQKTQRTVSTYQERLDRYPVAESDEVEPTDPLKRAKLKRQKTQYDKDAAFDIPGPQSHALEFLPEGQFNFPAFPVSQRDLIVIGCILNAEAHQSDNKRNVFSNFDVRIDEVLKGNVALGVVISIQRLGGFVRYPGGRKVLFRLIDNGMPGVGARYALFLKTGDENNTIVTAYELSPQGVVPLDNSRQFEAHRGESEITFLEILRNAVSQPVSQQD